MSCAVCTRDVCTVLSAFVLASCQTCTPDNENATLTTMVINFVLSTHCVLMNVMCPQPSIAALIDLHSTDDNFDIGMHMYGMHLAMLVSFVYFSAA